MPGVNREQIEQAKQIDLLTYMQTYEPEAIYKTSENEYRLYEHNSLVISNGLWHWINGGFGGKSALDFLIKVRGMDFVNAVKYLCGCRSPPSSPFQSVTNETKQKSDFILPTPNWDNSKVIAYLQSRGIDMDIIENCIKNETLYQSKKYGNCVFVGRDRENNPRFACVRSTTSNFRQDVAGSDKKYSFCINASESDARFLVIAESPIDIMSIATLRKMNEKSHDKYNYLSLDGTSTAALMQYLDDNPKINHIILSLDNDTAGRKAVNKIKEVVKTNETLKNKDISVITELPPEKKDFNNVLMEICQNQKETTKVRDNADIFI